MLSRADVLAEDRSTLCPNEGGVFGGVPETGVNFLISNIVTYVQIREVTCAEGAYGDGGAA